MVHQTSEKKKGNEEKEEKEKEEKEKKTRARERGSIVKTCLLGRIGQLHS